MNQLRAFGAVPLDHVRVRAFARVAPFVSLAAASLLVVAIDPPGNAMPVVEPQPQRAAAVAGAINLASVNAGNDYAAAAPSIVPLPPTREPSIHERAMREPMTRDRAAEPDYHRADAPADHLDQSDDDKRSASRWRILRPGVVKSKSGATARVAHRHTAKFQCLVDWLDEQGFRITAMGGIAPRPFGGSLHPIGAALDIDQASRNRLFRGKRFPEGTNAAASRCGLMHGDRTAWPNYPDYGHFQVAGVTRGNWRRRQATTPVQAQAETQATTSGVAAPVRPRVHFARSITERAPVGATNGAQDVR